MSEQATKILLADDHSMIRRGLKIFLQTTMGFPSVGEVSTCSELLLELNRNRYTHLILDIILKDGNSLEVLPTLRRLFPDLRIMMFSMQPTEIYGPAIRQYQIHQYMHKTASEEEMLIGLGKFIKEDAQPSNQETKESGQNPFSSLAPRELEILHYLLKGMGTKHIGETLNLRMSTISTVKNRIFEKTGAQNLKDLIELAALYSLNY
ncbi:MAG: response regulator [Bacteroidota bacterium]|jgi:DNA-binding NarL/FixJ family response regulator